jgi:hypothetical protein
LGVLLNASLLAPDLLPTGDIDAASHVNEPPATRVSPIAVPSAHAVLEEAKRKEAVKKRGRTNRKKKGQKMLLPVTEQL